MENVKTLLAIDIEAGYRAGIRSFFGRCNANASRPNGYLAGTFFRLNSDSVLPSAVMDTETGFRSFFDLPISVIALHVDFEDVFSFVRFPCNAITRHLNERANRAVFVFLLNLGKSQSVRCGGLVIVRIIISDRNGCCINTGCCRWRFRAVSSILILRVNPIIPSRFLSQILMCEFGITIVTNDCCSRNVVGLTCPYACPTQLTSVFSANFRTTSRNLPTAVNVV